MKDKVYVWDSFIRIFHWSLVLLFVISYLTGDENETVHVYSGYAVLALLVTRILWGFVGTKRARFGDFVRPPAEAYDYLKGLFTGTTHKYEGHNPAGGWMTLMLIASLLLTGFSGLKLYGVEGHGPLAMVPEPTAISDDTGGKRVISREKAHDEHEDKNERNHGAYEDEEAEEFWEEIHEFFVDCSLFLIILHIAGVLLSSLKQRENLVGSMVTGYKNK